MTRASASILLSASIHFGIILILTAALRSRIETLSQLRSGSTGNPLRIDLSHSNGPSQSHASAARQKPQALQEAPDKMDKKDKNVQTSDPPSHAGPGTGTGTVNSSKSSSTPGQGGLKSIGAGDPYYAQVRMRIQSKIRYSDALARRRLQGQVLVEITLLPDGKLSSVGIRQGSGHPELDSVAIAAIQAAAPFERFDPNESARKIALPIDFRFH